MFLADGRSTIMLFDLLENTKLIVSETIRRIEMIFHRLLIVGATLLASAVAFTPAQQDQPDPPVKMLRGAKPTPFPKIIEALKSGKAIIHKQVSAPAQVIVVPKRLSMWGNSQYGDCVSAESAFSIAAYSTYVGVDEIFVTEPTIISWAKTHGFLNGADLLEVMQAMSKDGVKDEKGMLRKAGTPSTVDYSNEATLQSALAVGPVSIAIDANALPSGAGNSSGWHAFGGGRFPNTDHCVSLAGYGASVDLCKALGVAVPSGAPTSGYLLFTWNTIGIVDHKWLMGTCVEAWVRTPTVTGLTPPTPPQPTKITVAVADVTGGVNSPVKFMPIASGGTSPYIFLFDYGDGSQDAAGQHSYSSQGTYKVTVTAVDSTGQTGTTTCSATIGTTPVPPGPTPNGNVNIRISDGRRTFDLVIPRMEFVPSGTTSDLRLLLNKLEKKGP